LLLFSNILMLIVYLEFAALRLFYILVDQCSYIIYLLICWFVYIDSIENVSLCIYCSFCVYLILYEIYFCIYFAFSCRLNVCVYLWKIFHSFAYSLWNFSLFFFLSLFHFSFVTSLCVTFIIASHLWSSLQLEQFIFE